VAAGSLSTALAVVPAAHREVVRAALIAVLGAAPVDAIKPISAGISAGMILRVESHARCYLVRVEGPRSPLRYPHQYESMRIAAEAGIAPRVHYIDEANGVAVMDFAEERPLRSYPGGRVALVQALGALLRRLNDTPVFPSFIGYPEIVARLTNALLGAWLGRAADDALQARLAQARAFSRLYYAGVLLSRSAGYPRSAPDADLSAPTLTEFEAAIREGRHERGTSETVHVMGKMYLSGFRTGAAVPPLVEI